MILDDDSGESIPPRFIENILKIDVIEYPKAKTLL
jgi:hypothetical protein